LATTSKHVFQAIETLYTQEHDFQTVVLDSADWYEQILQREIESTHDAKDLAFGKGTLILAERWKQLLDGLNALRNDKGMAVILIGHCQIKRFESPETESYDRYEPKCQGRASALIQEWADAVLFANYRVMVRKEDAGFNKSVAKGMTTGERLLHTQETPAYLAKNRYALPQSLPLDWSAFQTAMNATAA